MQETSDHPEAAVTLEEALAKLIGYEGVAVPEELLRAFDKDEWTDKAHKNLSNLNRKLDFCTVDDCLGIRIEVLKGLLQLQLKTDIPEDAAEAFSCQELQDAIEVLEFKREHLDYIRSHLQNDLRLNPDCIKRAPSPSGIKRYQAASFAKWARETREIHVPSWYDISNIDLYGEDQNIPGWIDAKEERLSAHFDVLNGLLKILLRVKPENLSGSNRNPSDEWRGPLKKNGTVNRKRVIEFVQHQFDRLEPPENVVLPQQDAYYERLNDWHKYYLTGLYNNRPTYTQDSIKNTQIIIAGLIIGLGEDSYGDGLADLIDEPWPAPKDLQGTLYTDIPRISSGTIDAITKMSIARLMHAVRYPE